MAQKRIIVVRLIGGLGNQLFQIQFAMYIENFLGVTVFLDDSYSRSSKKPHEIINQWEIFEQFKIITLSKSILRRRLIERLFFKAKLHSVIKRHAVYVFEQPAQIFHKYDHPNLLVFDGFWQQKKYLSDELLFNLRKIFNINNAQVTQDVENRVIVCIHVRRGDYLTNMVQGKLAQLVLPLSYYLKAIKLIDDLSQYGATYHIYTDDEEWVYDQFGFNPLKFVIIKTANYSAVKLLQRMSFYKYYIIANSTISWWAAVLSGYPNKTVYLPKYWSESVVSDAYALNGWNPVWMD